LVVRCVMLPAVLQLLGRLTWKFPSWLDKRLPQLNIEGTSPAIVAEALDEREPREPEPEPVGGR
jgi:RND superfamily putative drug exporter